MTIIILIHRWQKYSAYDVSDCSSTSEQDFQMAAPTTAVALCCEIDLKMIWIFQVRQFCLSQYYTCALAQTVAVSTI
jgi:hypothetical protein